MRQNGLLLPLKTDHYRLKIRIGGSEEMIVVTGATGHIGNVLIRELITRGQTVRALVLPDDDCRPLCNAFSQEWKPSDLSNYLSWIGFYEINISLSQIDND